MAVGVARSKSLRNQLETRWSELNTDFTRWEPHFRQLRDYVQPRRGRFSLGERRETEFVSNKIIDAEARRALRTLESGLMAGMTSPSRPWFRLGLRDSQDADANNTRLWLHTVEGRMYEVLRVSNIYNVLPMAYRELGLFGSDAMLLLPDFDTVVHGFPFTMGEYRIASDPKGRIDTVYRRINKTVKFLVETFGKSVSKQVQTAFDNGNLAMKHPIFHAIEPNINRRLNSPAPQDRPFASVYWDAQDADDKLLEVAGYVNNPLVASRWEVLPDEDYGFSPAMDALGDAKQLQSQHFFKAEGIQKQVRPPMVAPVSLRNAGDRPNTSPSGVTFLDTASMQKGGFRSAFDVKPDIQGLLLDINQTQERIRSSFFADLFLLTAMSDRRQVTATEIAERHEEKLLMLGPVLERLQNELLQRVIELVFTYMQEAQLIPEAPEDMVGSPLRVEYISTLAQAQKAVGVASIERTVGFAGTLAQLGFPEALDKINADQAVDEFAAMVGPAPTTVRSDEEVAQIRADRQEQERMQQLIEAAPAMTGAAKVAADIADRGQAGQAEAAAI